MREAYECLNRATVCDTLAGQAQDATSVSMLRDIADQWRQLAHDTDRHKRIIERSAGNGPRAMVRTARRVA